MPKITPFLWFNDQAEEAMNFYASIFTNAKKGSISRCGEGGPGPKGSFMALNGRPHFFFTPAISMFVNCETQEEVDHYWERLSDGSSQERCGWLKDKFGLSWQIVPSILGKLLSDKNAAKSSSVMKAMLQMKKLDIAGLQQAYEQG